MSTYYRFNSEVHVHQQRCLPKAGFTVNVDRTYCDSYWCLLKIEALHLIFGPLNTGFTVTSSNVLTLNSNVNAGFWSDGHLVGSHFVLRKWIGHFRFPLCLCFKASLSEKPFLWKWLWFAWKWNCMQNSSSCERYHT